MVTDEPAGEADQDGAWVVKHDRYVTFACRGACIAGLRARSHQREKV
jgi:hypothetical protein